MRNLVETIERFLRETIWLERRGSRKAVRFGIRTLRVVFLVGKGFYDDKCFLRASGLAFTTVLSLVPLLAFAFSVLKGFGAEDMVRDEVIEYVAVGQDELEIRLKEYIDSMTSYVTETRVGALGGLSLLFLLYTSIKVLSTAEDSFNDIWGVTKGRRWLRKFSDYTSVIIIGPVLLASAIAVSTYLSANPLAGEGVTLSVGRYLLRALAWMGPYALTILAFAALYAFMPNTRVSISAALIGGLVAGLLWQGAFWSYTHLQVVVARQNAIYGAFAAVPIFLVWLYVSWVITLFAAEVAFAYEHVETYRQRRERFEPSARTREVAALRVFLEVAKAFHDGAPPPDADRLSDASGVPVRAVNDVADVLVTEGLLSRIESGKALSFQPGRDISRVTAGDVMGAVRRHGEAMETPEGDLIWAECRRLGSQFEAALAEGDFARNIIDILESDTQGA